MTYRSVAHLRLLVHEVQMWLIEPHGPAWGSCIRIQYSRCSRSSLKFKTHSLNICNIRTGIKGQIVYYIYIWTAYYYIYEVYMSGTILLAFGVFFLKVSI